MSYTPPKTKEKEDPFNNLPLLGEVKVVTKVKPHQPKRTYKVKVPVLVFNEKIDKENSG